MSEDAAAAQARELLRELQGQIAHLSFTLGTAERRRRRAPFAGPWCSVANWSNCAESFTRRISWSTVCAAVFPRRHRRLGDRPAVEHVAPMSANGVASLSVCPGLRGAGT